ncbi:MAG: autotransporter domain-containing protein [Parachlamydia sp.]|nr:autotransporter domain-containing protein [Parachlamydia sp.]
MKTISRPFFKMFFFSLSCFAFNHADDLQWKGANESYLENVLGGGVTFLEDKFSYEPKPQKFNPYDRIFFTNNSSEKTIKGFKATGAEIAFGSFIFHGDKELSIDLANKNTLSLYHNKGVVNLGAQPVIFHLDQGATLNFCGTCSDNLVTTFETPVHYQVDNGASIHFSGQSCTGPAQFHLNHSHLIFSGHSNGEKAAVHLGNHSTLNISTTNSAHSLNSITSDSTSLLQLNNASLNLGNAGTDDVLNGTVSGNASSYLVKQGSGTLSLKGDCQSFSGTIVAANGKVILEKNLGGNVEVGKAVFEFDDKANAGSNIINVTQGHVVFKKESTAGISQINVRDGGIAFQNQAQGGQAVLSLGENSTLSLDQNNSLGALNSDQGSSTFLNSFALTLGSQGHECRLAGEIIGNPESKLIKEGMGTLFLHGNHASFFGDTVINGGILALSGGHLGGNLIANQATRVVGAGSIAKNLINQDGWIALNANENLTIGGDFFQSEKGECHLQMNRKGECSRIAVGGTASLNDSTLKISGDFRLCCPYVILDANKIDGSFGESDLVKLPSTIELLKNLETAENREKMVLRFVPHLDREELSSTQQSIALQLKNINSLSDEHEKCLLGFLQLEEKEIPHALDQVSGDTYTHFFLANERATGQFIRRLYTPLRAISIDHDCEELCMNQSIAWGDVEAGKTFKNGKHGYSMLEYNMTAGVQRSMNDWLTESCPLSALIPCDWLVGWTAGLAGSYSYLSYDFDHDDEALLHDTKGAIYALLTKSMYYVLTDFIFGYTTGHLDRSIKCGCLNEKSHGNVDMFNASFYGELGLNNIFCCNLSIQPFVGIETGYFNLHGCKEHGAKYFDLNVKGQAECLTTSYLGLHIYNFSNDDCAWGFSADFIWKHLFEPDIHLDHQFVCFGDKFSVSSHKASLNGLVGAFTYFQRLSHSWIINAEISGEVWENYSNFYLSAGCSYKW